MRNLAALILAAGGSTRMGRAKQLLTVDGKTLLSRAIDTAVSAGCSPVIVVIGAQSPEMRLQIQFRPDVKIAENPNWEKGIGTSIRQGIVELLRSNPAAKRVILLLCDQPAISAETIRRLDAEQCATGQAVCVSAYANTVGPPVLVTGMFLAKLLAVSDPSGAKSIWTNHPEAVCRIDCPEAALDIDTPDDYAAFIKSD